MATISLDQLVITLGGWQNRTTSFLPVMRAAGIMGVSEIQGRFQTSSGPKNERWAPLKFSRIRGGDKPLLDTGMLRASFTAKPETDSLTIGTAAVQAPLMQFGGTVVPKKGQFLSLPMTKEALRAGSPRRMVGLRAIVYPGGRSGILRDARGVTQWLLVKKTDHEARPFMGFSDQWRTDVSQMIVDYVLTGAF